MLRYVQMKMILLFIWAWQGHSKQKHAYNTYNATHMTATYKISEH